jgi:hypothetical protein
LVREDELGADLRAHIRIENLIADFASMKLQEPSGSCTARLAKAHNIGADKI